jgi:hypothetical protein
MIDGIAKRLNACVATFKGLGVISVTYREIPAEFINNLDKASEILASLLPQLARSKKMTRR